MSQTFSVLKKVIPSPGYCTLIVGTASAIGLKPSDRLFVALSFKIFDHKGLILVEDKEMPQGTAYAQIISDTVERSDGDEMPCRIEVRAHSIEQIL